MHRSERPTAIERVQPTHFTKKIYLLPISEFTDWQQALKSVKEFPGLGKKLLSKVSR